MFDGSSGEWLARIAEAGKKRMALYAWSAGRASRRPFPDVWLAFAPVKRTQTDWLVGKGNGAWRREAHARDDSAHDRGAGEAGAAGGNRHRGRRAMRTHAASGDRGAGAARAIAQSRRTARSISRTKAAASRRCRHSKRVRRRSSLDPRAGSPTRSGPRSAPLRTRSRFRLGRASSAPRRQRSLHLPPTWRSRATGAEAPPYEAINRNIWRGPERAAKRRSE